MRTSFLPGAALAALLAAATAAPASGQQLTEEDFRSGTAGDLADLCGPAETDPMRGAGIGWCHGFLLAAGQYHATMAAAGTRRHPLFCLPEPTPSFDQVRGAFVAWVRANPQHANDRALDGFMRFAATAYPCPPQQRSRR